MGECTDGTRGGCVNVPLLCHGVSSFVVGIDIWVGFGFGCSWGGGSSMVRSWHSPPFSSRDWEIIYLWKDDSTSRSGWCWFGLWWGRIG